MTHILGLSKESYIQAVIQGIHNRQGDDIIVRLLLSMDRVHPLENNLGTVNLAIRYKGIIVGIDVCGDPNKGNWDNVKEGVLYLLPDRLA